MSWTNEEPKTGAPAETWASANVTWADPNQEWDGNANTPWTNETPS